MYRLRMNEKLKNDGWVAMVKTLKRLFKSLSRSPSGFMNQNVFKKPHQRAEEYAHG